MIFREFFMLLLLSHVIGDFYFQTETMADKKTKSLKWVFTTRPLLLGSRYTGFSICNVISEVLRIWDDSCDGTYDSRLAQNFTIISKLKTK